MLFSLAQIHSGPSGFEQTVDRLARTPLSQILLFVAILTAARLALAPLLAKVPPHRRGTGYVAARILNEMFDAVVYAGVVVFMLVRPFAIQTFRIPTGSMIPQFLENDFIIVNKAVYRISDPKVGDIVVFRPPKHALNPDQQETDFIKRLIGQPGDVIEIRYGALYRNGVRFNEPYLNNQFISSDWKLVHYNGTHAPWRGKYIPVAMRMDDSGMVANHATSIAWPFAIGGLAGPSGKSKSYPDEWKPPTDLTVEERRLMRELIEAPPAAVPQGQYLMLGDNRDNSYDGRAWGLIGRQDIVGRSELIWWPLRRGGKTPSTYGLPASEAK